MKVPVSFRTLHAMADKNILVDSGATDNFIHPKLLKRLGLGAQALDRPRKIWNIDGTTNRAGQLTSFVDLEVRTGNKEEKMRFLVTDLGNEDLILGYPWLATFEPQFNWRNSVVDTAHLPIIVRSLDWRKGRFRPIVARMVAGRRVASAPPRLSHMPSWQSSKSSNKSAPTLGGYPPTSPPKQDNTPNRWQYLPNISNMHRSSVKKNRVDFLPRVPGTTPSTSSQAHRNPSTAKYTPPRLGNGPTSVDGSTTC
jgi:hypothetical protein